MKKNIFQKEAKKAFLIELNELKAFYASKDFNVGDLCQEILNCKGKVFLTGVGKSGHIANKISATFSRNFIFFYTSSRSFAWRYGNDRKK